jgi:hypothetical protein
MEHDLPADGASLTGDPLKALIAYLQQVSDAPAEPAANPKKLVGLVAILSDEEARLYGAAGRAISNYPVTPGAPLIPKLEAIIRSDHISSTSYVTVGAKACTWIYIQGRHKLVC